MICYTIYMMNNRGIIKAGEATAIESLVATLYCPTCENIISEMREDPRIDGDLLPFCKECEIYWKPTLKKIFLHDHNSYVLQVHLQFAIELEAYWQVGKDEIRLDEATPTAAISPPSENLQPAPIDSEQMFEPAPHLNAEMMTDADDETTGTDPNADSNPQSVSVSNPQETDEVPTPSNSEKIYDLAERFIDNEARIQGEFTYPEIEAYVSQARGGYVSSDGLHKQLNNLIEDGKIQRLQRNRYLRLK